MEDGQRLAARAEGLLTALLNEPLDPGLYLVATPIGNLADITLRALSVLARAEVVYCEDTRHSRKIFTHYDIKGALKPYHEHNAARERPRILKQLQSGKTIAVISDAGTPLISDPGFKLARGAREAGVAVMALPGASAPITALVSSGLPSDRFLFEGFLPNKTAARRKRIEALSEQKASLILFEAANRLEASLADLAGVLGPREAAIAKELTKAHEAIHTGPLDQLADQVAGWPADQKRGEYVLVVAGAGADQVSDEQIKEALQVALEGASVRDASRAVADDLGIAKTHVYKLALALGGKRDGEGGA